MTSSRIKEVALTHFANNGYEGASLADIATEVGIKKQSIYTHFRGKNELFLEVFKDVLSKELEFIKQYFDHYKNAPLNDFLYRFLMKCMVRYDQHDNTKFFLRMVFFPPSHLQSDVATGGNYYIEKIEEWLIPVFQKAGLENSMSTSVNSETATAAFTAVLDGMFVEMLFGGTERSLRRIEASWFVYWQGIKNDKMN